MSAVEDQAYTYRIRLRSDYFILEMYSCNSTGFHFLCIETKDIFWMADGSVEELGRALSGGYTEGMMLAR